MLLFKDMYQIVQTTVQYPGLVKVKTYVDMNPYFLSLEK